MGASRTDRKPNTVGPLVRLGLHLQKIAAMFSSSPNHPQNNNEKGGKVAPKKGIIDWLGWMWAVALLLPCLYAKNEKPVSEFE